MAWTQYRRLLHAHPLKTKALTSACITGLADIGLQLYEKNSNTQAPVPEAHQRLDFTKYSSEPSSGGSLATLSASSAAVISHLPEIEWSRTLTLATVGLIYSGPINHFWFAALEKLVRTQQQVVSVVLKLAIDQIVFVPVAISGYIATRGMLEGKSDSQVRAQLRDKLMPATNAAWHFWPVVNLISFSVVPVVYRVLFGNACAIFWNARLSSISSQPTGRIGNELGNTSTAPMAKVQATLSCSSIMTPTATQASFGIFMAAVVEKVVEQAVQGSPFS